MVNHKTDNANSIGKLALRRYFLNKYAGPHRVIDCCQGGGVMWGNLKEEFELQSYWGLDQKPKKGRLKIDSSRVLAQKGWDANVIDIDTYGSPWRHWFAMLPNITGPTTVFLTIGQATQGIVGSLSKEAIGAMGLGPIATRLPKAFHVKLGELSTTYALTAVHRFGVIMVEAVEAQRSRNARYIGVRLEPVKTAAPGAVTPGQPQHRDSVRRTRNV